MKNMYKFNILPTITPKKLACIAFSLLTNDPYFSVYYLDQGATDVVVLRGWYNRITISLYGYFTDVNQRPQESRPEPRVERPPVIVETRAPERDPERLDRESEKAAHERIPEQAERTHDRGPERPMRRERSAERSTSDSGPIERGTDERVPERSSESRDRREEPLPLREEKRVGKDKERTPVKSPSKLKSPPRSPESVTATIGESTAAKPTTPPGSPREEVCSRSMFFLLSSRAKHCLYYVHVLSEYLMPNIIYTL